MAAVEDATDEAVNDGLLGTGPVEIIELVDPKLDVTEESAGCGGEACNDVFGAEDVIDEAVADDTLGTGPVNIREVVGAELDMNEEPAE